jgi:Tfp pilus assembly protein PilZ
MEDLDTAERRQGARLRFQGSVAVAPIPRSVFNPPIRVVTKDLSDAGVGFVSPEPFPVGARLVVDLELPGREEPVYTLGHVVWVESVPDGRNWRVGVALSNLSMTARARLQQFVAERSGSRRPS